MAIDMMSFPKKNGGSFHSYVKLPEGTYDSIMQERKLCLFSHVLYFLMHGFRVVSLDVFGHVWHTVTCHTV